MLIRRAELLDLPTGRCQSPVDVQVTHGTITAVRPKLPVTDGDTIDAAGGLLLPGLADHHMHLYSAAAALNSVSCGPPYVSNTENLKTALWTATGEWIRGVGYHESVAGDLDCRWLDRHGPRKPVRIQHRTGRLWIFNGLALQRLRTAGYAGDLPDDGKFFDLDASLFGLLSDVPPVELMSRRYSQAGVTSLHDMTPSNDNERVTGFDQLRRSGQLRQKLRVSGQLSMATEVAAGIATGETKFHLHEDQFPDFADFCSDIAGSHDQNRGVAVHCVTEASLVFTLAALREVGAHPSDRIEHASVIPDALLTQIQEQQLLIVTQPNFVAERGDAYLVDIAREEHAYLYRDASLRQRGVTVAYGSDAPFGDCDPWSAMAAACFRTTPTGAVLGEQECVTPEQALAGFLGELHAPGVLREISVGRAADLCLLDSPWTLVREDLDSRRVRMTFIDGEQVYERGRAQT